MKYYWACVIRPWLRGERQRHINMNGLWIHSRTAKDGYLHAHITAGNNSASLTRFKGYAGSVVIECSDEEYKALDWEEQSFDGSKWKSKKIGFFRIHVYPPE